MTHPQTSLNVLMKAFPWPRPAAPLPPGVDSDPPAVSVMLHHPSFYEGRCEPISVGGWRAPLSGCGSLCSLRGPLTTKWSVGINCGGSQAKRGPSSPGVLSGNRPEATAPNRKTPPTPPRMLRGSCSLSFCTTGDCA